MEKLQGTIIDIGTDTDSSDDEKSGEEGNGDDTFLTTPDVETSQIPEVKGPSTPAVQSTPGSFEERTGDWEVDTPCPKGRGRKLDGGRESSFMGKMGEKDLEAMLSSGAAAQGRRSVRS
jgi:hypothetical protein